MKVVINRSDAIGDVLLTLPMASFLKSKVPDCHITFIVSPLTAPLFENSPVVDNVLQINPKQNKLSLFLKIRALFKKLRPDVYLYVGGTHTASVAALSSRVPFRGGLKSRFTSFLTLNKGIRQSRSMSVMHESEYNLNLLRPLGLQYSADMKNELSRSLINLTQEEKEIFTKDLHEDLSKASMDTSKEYIVIHPGMSGHTLNWTSRNYAKLIAKLYDDYSGKYNFLVTFTPSDNDYLIGLRDFLSQTKYKELQNQIFYMDGTKRGLRFSLFVLSRAALFVGPSTGPSHMANAMDVKQIGIYSPIKVQSALRWGPMNQSGQKVQVIVPDVVCGEIKKCAGRECPYFECMSKVEVDNVLSKAHLLLY